MNCLHCNKETSEPHFFAEVFLCKECFDCVTRIYDRNVLDLNRLCLLLKESLRIALLEKRLFQDYPKDISKTELFREIVKLDQRKLDKS